MELVLQERPEEPRAEEVPLGERPVGEVHLPQAGEGAVPEQVQEPQRLLPQGQHRPPLQLELEPARVEVLQPLRRLELPERQVRPVFSELVREQEVEGELRLLQVPREPLCVAPLDHQDVVREVGEVVEGQPLPEGADEVDALTVRLPVEPLPEVHVRHSSRLEVPESAQHVLPSATVSEALEPGLCILRLSVVVVGGGGGGYSSPVRSSVKDLGLFSLSSQRDGTVSGQR